MASAGNGGSAPAGSGGSAGAMSGAGSGGTSGVPIMPDSLGFAEDIHPILVARCGSCHASGFLPRFASSNVQAAYDVAVDLSDTIVALIQAGDMPPACSGPPGSSGCVSKADFESIQEWVTDGTPE
jgi:hypothetical protein